MLEERESQRFGQLCLGIITGQKQSSFDDPSWLECTRRCGLVKSTPGPGRDAYHKVWHTVGAMGGSVSPKCGLTS